MVDCTAAPGCTAGRYTYTYFAQRSETEETRTLRPVGAYKAPMKSRFSSGYPIHMYVTIYQNIIITLPNRIFQPHNLHWETRVTYFGPLQGEDIAGLMARKWMAGSSEQGDAAWCDSVPGLAKLSGKEQPMFFHSILWASTWMFRSHLSSNNSFPAFDRYSVFTLMFLW